ncbi:Protein Zgrf1 [Manis pentadactyla]|nr:Protein Zgrf1 [Manis pentadactyla]
MSPCRQRHLALRIPSCTHFYSYWAAFPCRLWGQREEGGGILAHVYRRRHTMSTGNPLFGRKHYNGRPMAKNAFATLVPKALLAHLPKAHRSQEGNLMPQRRCVSTSVWMILPLPSLASKPSFTVPAHETIPSSLA